MDGSLMGLGVSRSVPSSPGAGERSPSDKFNMASSSQDTGATMASANPGPASDTATVRYNNNKVSNNADAAVTPRRVLSFPGHILFPTQRKVLWPSDPAYYHIPIVGLLFLAFSVPKWTYLAVAQP